MPKPLVKAAGLIALGCAAAAGAQTPGESPLLAADRAALHGACARDAARALADALAAPLARQGRWSSHVERARRASFRAVRDAVAPGRPPAETFVALLDYAESAEAAQRHDGATAAATAVRERYLALVYLLDAVLPVLAFEAGTADVAELLAAADRLLADAAAEARGLRSEAGVGQLTRGVDYVDEGTLRTALDGARGEYQQCVLAGTLAAGDGGQRDPAAVGEATRCMLAVSGEPRPTALADLFRPSGLLAAECPAVLAAAPAIVSQTETLLEQRRQSRAASLAPAGARPATPPEQGPLANQILSPRELGAWLGRTYTAEMYCHREAATVYRTAFAPFIDAAEAVAIAALDRELESRAARTRTELERRLESLDRVLTSAVNIDETLATHGVRGVSDARASLRNLTAGAVNQRDAFERALAALDPAALAAERTRRVAEIAAHYRDERRRLDEWRSRFDLPPDPREHPAVAGRASPLELDFPYGVQHPDRALRNGVQGAANAANAQLNACRAANAGAVALVRPAPSTGVCDTWPPRDRFLQWGFVRAAERATAERCSVDLTALGAPLGLEPAPHDEAELARLAALAAATARATPAPDLPGALARIDALTADFNDRLGEVDRRLAAIRAKLDAGSGERLAAVAPPDAEAEPASAEIEEPADARSEPLAGRGRTMDEICREREAELRATRSPVLGDTVFVRYDEAVVLQRWSEVPRPDGRPHTVGDPCQVVYCPAGTQTYEECLAHTAATIAKEQEAVRRAQQRRENDRLANWFLTYVLPDPRAAADRFYNAQGDTWYERLGDRAVTLTCTMLSLAPPARLTVEAVTGALMVDEVCDFRLEGGNAR